MICGIGRGDSVVRVMKRKPAKLADLEHAINVMHTLTSRRARCRSRASTSQIEWAGSRRCPSTSPATARARSRWPARLGDGVIFQVADPYFIEWGMQFVRKGAEEAGRDLAEIVIHCSTATYISGDMDEARERTRWFPALVGNHIADVLRHHDAENLPPALDEYIHDAHGLRLPAARPSGRRPQQVRPRRDHATASACNGTEEQIEAKLRDLAALGVSEFNIYPYIPNLLETIDVYGRRIVPEVNAATRRALREPRTR